MVSPGTTTLVIFGASGDLTHRKLIPSLYNLYRKGRLDPELRIVGVSRRPMTDQEFRDSLARELAEGSLEPETWREFSPRVH